AGFVHLGLHVRRPPRGQLAHDGVRDVAVGEDDGSGGKRGGGRESGNGQQRGHREDEDDSHAEATKPRGALSFVRSRKGVLALTVTRLRPNAPSPAPTGSP